MAGAAAVADEEAAEHLYAEHVVGYLAVDSADLEDILSRGYVCSLVWDERAPPAGHETCHTSRINVPFSHTRQLAVENMRKYRRNEFSTILEIHRKNRLTGEMLAEERVVSRNGRCWVEPDADSHVLDRGFLSEGIVHIRGMAEYADVPCPFCKKIPGQVSLRGRVGCAQYIRNAFMVVPCREEDCIKAQEQRQERLNDEATQMVLYHACSREIADQIRRCGGKFIRGSGGQGGGGIYFAHTPRETHWKAENMGKNGIVLECRVSLGRMMKGGRDEPGTTFASLIAAAGGPFDSLCLDRGQTGYDVDFSKPIPGTRIEDVWSGKAEKMHPGYEWVVFSWDQVTVLGEVPRDPPPEREDAEA